MCLSLSKTRTNDPEREELEEFRPWKSFAFPRKCSGEVGISHCIPVNPYWLSYNNDVPFLMTATKMNSDRPILEARKLLQGGNISRVLVIGLGFKPGESLTTNSPGLDYAKELLENKVDVTIYDPLLLVDDKTVSQFPRLAFENWNSEYLDSHFDTVTIAIKQRGVDFNVLKNCQRANIIKYADI